jgi:hypothetical protein
MNSARGNPWEKEIEGEEDSEQEAQGRVGKGFLTGQHAAAMRCLLRVLRLRIEFCPQVRQTPAGRMPGRHAG